MNTKEIIQNELNKLNEKQLNTIYSLIQKFPKNLDESLTLMEKLQQISISEDADFSKNIGIQLGRDVDE